MVRSHPRHSAGFAPASVGKAPVSALCKDTSLAASLLPTHASTFFPCSSAKENTDRRAAVVCLSPGPCFGSTGSASQLLQENDASLLLPGKPLLAPHLRKDICHATHLKAVVHALDLSKERC